MTTTDSPTAASRIARSTAPPAPSARPREKAPTDQDDGLFRWPRTAAVESIEQYFRFMNLVLDVNRHLVMCWTGRAGLLSAAAREQIESGGRSMPRPGPGLDEDGATQETHAVRQVAPERVVAPATPTQADPAQQPDSGVATTELDHRFTTRGRPATGTIDGLIGHLLDLDITGSLGTNR